MTHLSLSKNLTNTPLRGCIILCTHGSNILAFFLTKLELVTLLFHANKKLSYTTVSVVLPKEALWLYKNLWSSPVAGDQS